MDKIELGLGVALAFLMLLEALALIAIVLFIARLFVA